MGSHDLKPLYIIIVPVIIIFIVLNSGYLQRILTAATVYNTDYTGVEVNYYYFTEYIAYLAEYGDDTDALGFDPSVSLKDQTREDGENWQDYFITLGFEHLSETAYYAGLAEAAGYAFSEEELAAIDAKWSEIDADRALNNLSRGDYLVAYYGAGMTEKIFEAQLTMDVKAQAYKAYLLAQTEISHEAVTAYLDAHPELTSYASADLRMITLYGVVDATTGEVSEAYKNALSSKIEELYGRYTEDLSSFAALSDAFGEDASLRKTDGVLENVLTEDLPAVVAAWAFDGKRTAGDSTCLLEADGTAAYLVIYDGAGQDAAEIAALSALRRQAVEEEAEAAIEVHYQAQRHAMGMKFVGK